jgi:hypothetical protein
MAISRKPSRSPARSTAEAEIEALINRGVSPTGAEEAAKPTTVPLLLRVPQAMLDQIEAVLKARPVRLPRHTWILEAIHEKLMRER